MMTASRSRWRRGSCRGGFSLLELILALAILVGAVAVLGELVRIGTRNAAMARDLTRAQLLCESTLAEVAASVIVPQSGQVPLEDAEWLMSLELSPLDVQGLLAARVTVTQDATVHSYPVQFTLVRWITDPAIAAEESESATGDAASGTGGQP